MRRRRVIAVLLAGLGSLATFAVAPAPFTPAEGAKGEWSFTPEGYGRLGAHAAAGIEQRLRARR